MVSGELTSVMVDLCARCSRQESCVSAWEPQFKGLSVRKGEAQDFGMDARVALHPLAQSQAFAPQMLLGHALW